MTHTHILVTGAGGFVGNALCRALVDKGVAVRAAMRDAHYAGRGGAPCAQGAEPVVVGDIGAGTDWRGALDRVTAIVHLAARVHVMRESSAHPLAAFRAVNTAGTAHLARIAAASGVGRFVYVSTIKVNGEATDDGSFTETDGPAPKDPYAISKWEAEQQLRRIADETGLEVVIVRPPLVYGPGVKGNFATLLRAVARGLPMPFGRCSNSRSLLGLGNFVDALMRCIEDPAAAGETFVLSDGEDLSTPELIRRIAGAMQRPARLLPIPVPWLHVAAKLVGKGDMFERLCGSLRVDASKAGQRLGWRPPFTVDEELARTVDWFLGQLAMPASARV